MPDETNKILRADDKPAVERAHEARELNSYVKALMDNAFSYSLLLDRETKILCYSNSLLRLTGTADGGMFIGMPMLDACKFFNNTDFVEDASRRISRIMSGENRFVEYDTVVWPNGEKRMYRISYKRIVDADNDFDVILITAQDITDIRLEESERRINDLLNSTLLPCLIWNANGDVVAYNNEAARVFGISEYLSLEDFNEVLFSVQPEHQPDGRKTEHLRQNAIREALNRGFSQVAVQLKKSDGTPIYFSVNIARISWLSGYRLVTYYYDMTEIIGKEVAVKEAEERTQIMFDSMPLTANLIDKNFMFIDCNQETINLFGVSNKEEYIKKFYDLLPEYQPCGKTSRELITQSISKAFNDGYCRTEWLHKKLNGEFLPCEVTLIRINYKDDFYVMAYARDLREVKAAQVEADEANERVRLMLDSNPLMCIMRDDKGNIVDCNQEALNVLGVADKIDFCRNFYSFFPEYQPDGTRSAYKTEKVMKILDEEGSINLERYFQTRAGELVPVATKIVRIPWKNTRRYVSFSRDLRESKANEQRMQEITKKERETKIQSEAAHAANEAKSQFLSNMSHEIRTPLNSIMGFSELALDDDISLKTREYVDNILENAKWLLQIVNDILDISKIESGNVELENIPFDLRELLDACKNIVAPIAFEKNIELYFYAESSIRKKLYGDPTKLRQVLINLLSNAVKFTDSGRVSLFAVVEKTTDDSVVLRFEVKDTGIGMTPEQIERIFEPFMQADASTTRRYGGTGLGLSITKNILELIGSRLEIESAPGAGSRFGFRMSFNTKDTADKTSGIGSVVNVLQKPVFKGDVLVCEDNQMNRRVILEHLARVGLNAEIAENGLEGIKKVERRIEEGEKPFSLIFMDMHMPVMDGIEATPKIIALGSGTPVVAMTANIMTGDRELYKALGMSDYLGKPFLSQELWRCLLKYLKPVGFAGAGDDDKKLQNQLKLDFVKNNRTRFDEIAAAIDAGDLKLAHRLVHTLKSNAGFIGKTSLQNTAAEAEDLLKDGKMPIAGDLMNRLETELKDALEELRPLLDKAAISAAPVTFDKGRALALFKQVEPMLENINPECINFLGEIRAIPGTEALARQIEDYDFESAARTLAELKNRWV